MNLPIADSEYEALDAIQRRVLWLSTLMIHHANHVRPNPDGVKVGGHQASSASSVTILTTCSTSSFCARAIGSAPEAACIAGLLVAHVSDGRGAA